MELIKWLEAQRGRAKALAAELDVSSATVSEWANKKKPVPVERCTPVETFTKGEVTRRELREDWRTHWPELMPPAVDRRDPARANPYPDLGRSTAVAGEG